jgi:dTDP-4-dehydrorhamnose reductase
MERIVVIGASGMLGAAVVREIGARGLHACSPGRDGLDLARGGIEASLRRLGPAAVINTAAYTDVARAELAAEQGTLERLNCDAPGELAAACRTLAVPLIHVSTDYVFDGRKTTPYRESDPVAPLQAYGRSKLEGERRVLAGYPDALVVRTSTLYGPGRAERPHYVGAILDRARRGEPLRLVRLPVSSPSYAVDVAAGMLDLLAAGAGGIVHVVNAGGCSRIDLARAAIRLAGLEAVVPLSEIPAADAPPERPAYSVLDTARYSELTGRRIRGWREALADYVARPEG